MFARICVLLAVTAVGLLVAAPPFAARPRSPPSWAPTGVSTNDLCPSRTGTTFQATSGSFVPGLPLHGGLPSATSGCLDGQGHGRCR